MHDYTRLDVWDLAHHITLQTYSTTRGLPVEERFGLQTQMRRAAVSMVSNIAEGAGRDGARDFARFLECASGSACELDAQLLIASDLGYIPTGDKDAISESIARLRGKLNRLRSQVLSRADG